MLESPEDSAWKRENIGNRIRNGYAMHRRKLAQARSKHQRVPLTGDGLLPVTPQLLSATLAVHPAGVALLRGEQLEFLYVNPAYRKITPHPELDPIGRTYQDVWPASESFRGGWLLRRILHTGKPFRMDRYVQQFPDGRVRTFTLDLRTVTGEAEPTILMVLADISQMEDAYLRAEQAAAVARLRAMEADEGRQVLEAIMAYLPEGITIAAEPDARILMVSRFGQELTGRPAADLLGLPMDEQPEKWRIFYPEKKELVRPEDLPLSRAVLLGEVVRNEEWLLERADGSMISILCNAGPILEQNGQISGGVLAWQDITERKKTEQAVKEYARKLARSNRELQDFAFIASHDLQEPLRKIQAFGERLAKRAEGRLDPEGEDFLERMRSAAARMQSMITDLLAYSRIATKQQPFSDVPLEQVVHEVMSDLEMAVERNEGLVKVGWLPVIRADRTQMYQLFQNLLSNALKFHQQGQPPQVEVWAEVQEVAVPGAAPQVQIFVRDHGIGFEEQYLERIFQPFQRLHGRSEYDGSGIGLAICRKIVERHSGTITAHSEPGAGTTFLILMPVSGTGKDNSA